MSDIRGRGWGFEQAEEAVKRITDAEVRARWAKVAHWCANYEGLGVLRPWKAVAPGWFWKKDRIGKYFRIYRAPVSF